MPESGPKRAARVQNGRVIGADRRPGILARMMGSMLKTAREIACLSYDEAAARLGCAAGWLIRVETGFAVAGPDEVARILAAYGVREAAAADTIIDMARRAAAPPSWLDPHASRMSADARDVLLVEAEATLAQVHGCRLIPDLVKTEGYFREMAPGVYPERDPDEEWDLISHRQAHRPAGVTRLLDVIIDESALDIRPKRPEAMAGQSATCSRWPTPCTPRSASSPGAPPSGRNAAITSTSCPSRAPRTASASSTTRSSAPSSRPAMPTKPGPPLRTTRLPTRRRAGRSSNGTWPLSADLMPLLGNCRPAL